MKKKVYTIILLVLGILFYISLALPMIHLNLSAITGSLSSFFGDVDKWIDGTNFSIFKLLKAVLSLKEDAAGLVFGYFVIVLLPYVIITVDLVLLLLRTNKKYLIQAILTGVTLIGTIINHFAVIPNAIKNTVQDVIDQSVAGEFLSLFHAESVTGMFGNELAKVYRNSLGPGIYVQFVLMLCIVITSVLAFIFVRKEDVGIVRKIPQPVLRVLSGMYEGATVNFEPGEEIIVGRDPAVSHVIFPSEKISRKHCSIAFDELTGQFRVTDYSSNGTYIQGTRRIMRNQTQFVPRGTMIALGDKVNCIRVE